MPINPVTKQLIGFIFLLLICPSMPLGASDGSNYYVPSGASEASGSFRLVWEGTSHPIRNKSLTWSLSPNNGTATLSGSSGTDGDGRASFTLFFNANACGTYTIKIRLSGDPRPSSFDSFSITYGESCPTVPSSGTTSPPPAPKLEKISDDNQVTAPGDSLMFTVELQDSDGSPIPDVDLNFSILSGDGSSASLSPVEATTDANGRARTTLTLGTDASGEYIVKVNRSDMSDIYTEFTVTVDPLLPRATRLKIISGDEQQGLPGEALEKSFVVEVRDQFDKPLQGAEVTFSVTSGGGTLSATSAVTGADGRAESILTLGPDLGTITVLAAVTGVQEGQTFTAEGVRILKSLKIISGDNQQGPPGRRLENPFVVEVRDQFDKPLQGVQVKFSVTAGDGTLSAAIAATDSNGRAESRLTLGKNLGANTVRVSVTGIEEKKMFNAEGIRTPLAFWIILGDKQQGVVGTALANPFIVDVRDHSGEPLPGVQVMFSVTAGDGTLSVTNEVTGSNGRVESILTLGPNPGTNTVTVSVTGIVGEQSASATAVPPPIPEDVNGDDVVDILDLVSVASDLGNEGKNLVSDVNGDEVVNILDLVLVARAYGTAAAPANPRAPAMLTAADVGRWLAQAQTLDLTDATIQMGVLALEQLAAALMPEETALLPNYPNPFNPETWIPYQLSEDGPVSISIYDATGVLIRTLSIGIQSAGFYNSRDRAAYWDGRNDAGERVASGLYFYQLRTPSFHQTRRLVIVK